MPPKPDILFKNGNFWTGNPRDPSASYLACADSRITAVGRGKSQPDDAIDSIDLEGHFAMPGFIDAHTHFRTGGSSLSRLNLRSVRTELEFAEAVREYAKTCPDGKWILGGAGIMRTWMAGDSPRRTL